MDRLLRYAETLDTAAREAKATAQVKPQDHAFTVAEAYQVQKLSVDRRLSRGEKRISVKMVGPRCSKSGLKRSPGGA